MEAQSYQVILNGTVREGEDFIETQKRLANLFKMSEVEADKLLIGRPRKIRNQVDFETAKKYKIAIEKAGASCKILKNSDSLATDSCLPVDKQEIVSESSQQRNLIVQPPAHPHIATERKSDEKYCPACGKVIHFSAGFCPSCGAKQEAFQSSMPQGNIQVPKSADQKYCNSCATPMHLTARQCPRCGAIQSSGSTNSSKSKVSAALLAFFLGGIGAHRFYLGSVGMGILYLVFFWTGIPAIVALIEGIYYLSMSDEKFNLKVQTGSF
jgi:TM2 domain-containing membrane protein YozV/RNA polymerase subunit RPABC4/transcription elongation factor Spt4